MATLTFNGESFTVDHAAKGADYIHGYDANGVLIVSFDGVTDFSGFTYDGTYMAPSDCMGESCNVVRRVGGKLVNGDGYVIAQTEPWTFTLEDGSTVTKAVYVGEVQMATITITGSGAKVTVGGVEYTSATTLSVPVGTTIDCYVKTKYPDGVKYAYVYLNGMAVQSGEGTYSYTVVGNATIELHEGEKTSGGTSYEYTTITITEQ